MLLISVYLFEAVDCPPLQSPANGYLLGQCDTSYGSTCHFMCKDGYELVDPLSDVRICHSNGEWSGMTSVCRGKYYWIISLLHKTAFEIMGK